ncbi:hypothetical protein [Gluconobacter japonicus]|uniref:hypothetical protein n=1 Tax=Gluconobacter japonicus TaxID=376620 RepID=UPI0039ED96FA
MSNTVNWPDPSRLGYPQNTDECWPHMLRYEGKNEIFIWNPSGNGSWERMNPISSGITACPPETMATKAVYVRKAHFKTPTVILERDIEEKAEELFMAENPGRRWNYIPQQSVAVDMPKKPSTATDIEKIQFREKALQFLIDESDK